jgi:DNA-binding NarL/FixJ family response regulator
MLREIIESVVAGQSDMSIVGSLPTREPVIAALEKTPADVVIVGLRKAETAADLTPLLYERPRLKLLAISGDGGTTTIYELRPYSTALFDVSPTGLVDAIRAIVTAEAR